MRTEMAIIEYLSQLSKGVINLSPSQAKHIIGLVTGIDNNRPHVKMFQYNPTNSMWNPIRSIRTDADIMQQLLTEALEKRPVEQCYLYECYNDKGEFEGKIFTAHPELFD